jgi:hypothetical protein
MKNTEARCLPEKYEANVCTTICKNVVLIFVFSKPILIIRIEKSQVAEAYKKYFELMWKSCKVVES